MACDMSEPCKVPFLDSCQRRFLWTHKGVDLALHPVVGFVLEVHGTPHYAFEEDLEEMKLNEQGWQKLAMQNLCQ